MLMCRARVLLAAAVADAAPACAQEQPGRSACPHVLTQPRLVSVSEASLAALV
jgi:hypothetical protein